MQVEVKKCVKSSWKQLLLKRERERERERDLQVVLLAEILRVVVKEDHAEADIMDLLT